jgi:RHS repeat-associated protein
MAAVPWATPEELETQNNYTYDPMGNLLSDRREKLSNVEWTVAGKVKAVHRPQGSGLPELLFSYGAGGQRIAKTVGDPEGSGHRDHYVRDAQGNIMAVYRYHAGVMYTEERPIYGSKRVGLYSHRVYVNNSGSPSLAGGMGSETQSPTQPEVMQTAEKRYELTDHLGNVAAVVSGSLLISQNPASAYEPQLISAAGYEPFGSLLPGRNYSSDSYRFGFNGKEKDDEVFGAVGTFQDYGLRAYDTRVARFFSVDPLAPKYPELTPYQFASLTPIQATDLDGAEADFSAGKHNAVQYSNSDGPIDMTLIFLANAGGAAWNTLVDIAEVAINGSGAAGAMGTSKVLVDGTISATSAYNWIANTSGDEKMADVKAAASNPHTYENIVGGIALGRAVPKLGIAREGTVADGVISGAGRSKFMSTAEASTGSQGLTQVGRALQKHSGREGSSFSDVKFSHKTANSDGLKILNDIMDSKNQMIESAENGTTTIFDKTSGRGVNVSREGSFNGFRDSKDAE